MQPTLVLGCLNSGATLAKMSKRSVTVFLTDVEGNLDYFKRVLSLCPYLDLKEEHVELAHDVKLVYGGDVGDKGDATLRVAKLLVNTKERFPERVTLLLGNRDINKMRITSELASSQMELDDFPPGPYWASKDARVSPKQFLEKMIHRGHSAAQNCLLSEKEIDHTLLSQYNTKANRLRWMLDHTMGAGGDFERRRLELSFLQEKPENCISDEEVVKSYEESIWEGGILRKYLLLGQLGALDDQTLYVHGGLIGADGEGNQFSNFLSFANREHSVETVKDWINELNSWAQEELTSWQASPYWSENREDRGGDALMDYVVPPPRNSVVLGRHLTADGNPKALDGSVVERLIENGIRRVIVGHTPIGSCPTVIQHTLDDGRTLTVVMADTSYSDPTADDNRGQAASIVILDEDKIIIQGKLDDGREIGYAIPTNGKAANTTLEKTDNPLATACLSKLIEELPLDPYVGKPLEDGRWVKARFSRDQNDGSRYLLDRVHDRIYHEYSQASAAEVQRLLQKPSTALD